MNPDDFCISLLTSFGDILGATLLYLCFYFVYLTGNDSVRVTPSPMTMFHNTTSFFSGTTAYA
jgi:hypothetical protein